MTGLEACKGCNLSVRLTEDEIASILYETVRVKKLKLVPDELYHKRVGQCSGCDSLDYGTTCRHCGCLVKVRASFEASHCPHPLGARW